MVRGCLALPVGLTVSPGLGDSMGHSSWCRARCGALLCAAVSEALRAAGGQPELADVTLIPGSVSGSGGSAGLQSWKGERVLQGAQKGVLCGQDYSLAFLQRTFL